MMVVLIATARTSTTARRGTGRGPCRRWATAGGASPSHISRGADDHGAGSGGVAERTGPGSLRFPLAWHVGIHVAIGAGGDALLGAQRRARGYRRAASGR